MCALAPVVQALDLRAGNDVELRVIGNRLQEEVREDAARGLLVRLRHIRGRLPEDFHFDCSGPNAQERER